MKHQEIFNEVQSYISQQCADGEVILCNWSSESSEFTRFNTSRIRQSGHVEQIAINLELIQGLKHSAIYFTLSGDHQDNAQRIQNNLTILRLQIEQGLDDPYLNYNRDVSSNEDIRDAQLPQTSEVFACIEQQCGDKDFVGILASGFIYRGFCNSLGQSNWFQQQNTHCDWSLYLQADKAVKSSYGSSHWDIEAFSTRLKQSVHELSYMQRPAKTITAGAYRCYIAPSALAEIIHMLCYRGFGHKLQQTEQSSLQQLIKGERSLHADVHISEDNAGGLGPQFSSYGFALPEQVELVKNGQHVQGLCSARSAKEYSSEMNADIEMASSPRMEGGALKEQDILKELGTGIYINDLWYLNWSDPMAAQITGMTRFACFWIEDGEIIAPINVMRFDDSIFNLLGDELAGITEHTDFRPSAASYSERSCMSECLPGILVNKMKFTL
ncbi:MAG: TldE/PmbA family protein [Planctomycetes bacterium]|nr:TldE/PmbA family protein [Planctomycetota bacterium]